jgi:hypothetical protein
MVAARTWLASATGTQPSFSYMRSSRLSIGHIIHASLPGSSELTRRWCRQYARRVIYVYTHRPRLDIAATGHTYMMQDAQKQNWQNPDKRKVI